MEEKENRLENMPSGVGRQPTSGGNVLFSMVVGGRVERVKGKIQRLLCCELHDIRPTYRLCNT